VQIDRIRINNQPHQMHPTFITGNQNKADYLAKYLGHPVHYKKLDLDEIQSLDLKEIVNHKVRQAYNKILKPVIVEDVSLEFESLGGLPGPFVRFFVEKVPFENICAMIGKENRRATAKCVIGFYDGKIQKLFEGSLSGTIAEIPAGDNGFGWDRIFIPEGYNVTRAQLSSEDDQKTYLKLKPLAALKKYLEESHK
jgi:inosine triphosphate pyrophosphatase